MRRGREDGRTSVLISEPQLREIGLPFLPVMWGILKTYWERHGPGGAPVSWLDPVREMGPPSELLRPYDVGAVDVLGLSCYTWNWKLQCMIAAHVKAANPRCVVVAGGPDPDYKDVDFFRRHPYIDAIVVKDGEIPFTRILERVLAGDDPLGDPDTFADVPGLYLPGADGEGHRYTGQPEVPWVFDESNYLAQSAYYERLMGQLRLPSVAVWETNRGCPYKCSFCDWGSNTMSKLRRFDMDRIVAEAEWFGAHKVGVVTLADANFGILERDLEIVDLVVASHERYGYPGNFTYNTAKNHPDRTVAIAKRVIGSGLAATHILSIQHTDPEVLKATERSNISVEKQRQVVEELLAEGVPIYVQLILGIPGDSYPTWKKCFADLMEWGIHSYWWVFPYMLLPNAPAAEPEYMERWGIQTLRRYVVSGPGTRPRGGFDPIMDTPSRLVVETKTFSRDDWVRMSTYTAWIKALHNCALTQSIAVYLRLTHGVPYGRFYEDLIEHFCAGAELTREWNEEVLEHYRHYLADEDAIDFMDIPEFGDASHQVEPSRWLYVRICLRRDAFYGALADFLGRRYPQADNLASLIDYQRNIVILPTYDRTAGHEFETDLDWVEYFRRAHRRDGASPLPEPESTPGATVIATDQAWRDEGATVAHDWGDGDEIERWIRWLGITVAGRNSVLKNNFQDVALLRPEQLMMATAG